MKGWIKTTLGALVQDGSASYQTGPFGTALKASEYSPDGVPLISVGEIREGYLQVHSTTPRVNKVVLDRLPKYILRKDDIVFGRKGAIDRNAIINEAQDGWFLGSDGIRLRLSDAHNSLYFSYLLRSRSIGQWLMQNSQGAIMPTLNQGILDRLPISLPSLGIQEKIAAVLSALDAKIALNQRINVELEGMAKLLYDYWFVQYDFPLSAAQAAALGKPRLAGKPYRSSGGPMVYHEHLKREIPEGWSVHDLGDILSISRGASPRPIDEFLSDSGIPWIKISDATASDNRFILKTKQFILKEGGPMAKIVPPDTLILTNSATPAVPRITKIHSGVHDGWLVINGYTSGLSKDFMFHYFCHERPRIICLGNGSIFKNLKTDYIKGLKIALPPNGIWSEATDHFKLISDQIYNVTQQNQELTSLRDWLLPMLMNGQVRVG